MTDTSPDTQSDTQSDKSPKRWIKWVILGAVAAVVLFFAGIFVYANFINDAPDALDESDLSSALVATTDATIDRGTSSRWATRSATASSMAATRPYG